jgi:SAM-dependent MidA family methyltransferase
VSSAAEKIKNHILQSGPLTFDQYVDFSLYDCEYGFYAKEHDIKDHFVTAPMMGSWLAQSLVSHWVSESQQILHQGITEWGAGRGDLMFSIMMQLHHLGITDVPYVCIERSSRQKQHILEKIKSLPVEIQNLVSVESEPASVSGIVLANEFLDALPFKRFVVEGGEAYEQVVNVKNGDLALSKKNESFECPIDVAQYPDGYESEVSPAAEAWFKNQVEVGQNCLWVIIDYGYLRDEYYHKQRFTGTFQAFRHHQVVSDWLRTTGLCDLTAHVDFSALIKQLSTHCPYRLRTQRQYLMDSGIFHEMKAPDVEQSTLLKTLMLPGQMGDLIKVFEVLKKEGA